eukprot:4003441-Amphidinium_carterae.1
MSSWLNGCPQNTIRYWGTSIGARLKLPDRECLIPAAHPDKRRREQRTSKRLEPKVNPSSLVDEVADVQAGSEQGAKKRVPESEENASKPKKVKKTAQPEETSPKLEGGSEIPSGKDKSKASKDTPTSQKQEGKNKKRGLRNLNKKSRQQTSTTW